MKSKLKPSREDNSESIKARAVILEHDKGYTCYGEDIKLHLKPSRGNNTESMKARVVILICDTLP